MHDPIPIRVANPDHNKYISDKTRSADDEQAIIQQACAGDRSAMAQILEKYQHPVYAICFRMVHNIDDAEDLTQEVLALVIQKLHQFQAKSTLTTWITRITINTAISHIRLQKNSKIQSISNVSDNNVTNLAFVNQDNFTSHDLTSVSKEPGGLNNVEYRERQKSLLQAMYQLEPDARILLILRDFQDLNYQQISQVLEIPVGTVKSRLFRVRLTLRREITQQRQNKKPTAEEEKQLPHKNEGVVL